MNYVSQREKSKYFHETVIQLTLINDDKNKLKAKINKLEEQISFLENTEHCQNTNNKKLCVNKTLSTGGVEISLIEKIKEYSQNNNMYLYVMTGIHSEKLAWRSIADTTPTTPTEFDEAIAFTEGASTCYVTDKIVAKKKISYVHTNYINAGYIKQLNADFYDKLDEIITINDQVRKAFLYVHPECLTKIKNNEIDLPKEHILQLSKEPLSNCPWTNIDIPTSKILTVSTLVKLTSYESMISATKILIDREHKFIWIALREGEEHSKLQNLINKYELQDRFILLGNVANPYPYFRKCDIYVHATNYEGKSIAAQEAKLLSYAIVFSKTDGNIEQIEDEITRLYCSTNDEEIARKIEKLIKKETTQNLETNVYKTITEEIKLIMHNIDILIINDFSNDKTYFIAKYFNVKIIKNLRNLWYRSSLQVGYWYAINNNYSFVVQFDSDNQHNAKNLYQIYVEIHKNNANIILGRRFVDSSFKISWYKKIAITIKIKKFHA